jgi:hypothetical protein
MKQLITTIVMFITFSVHAQTVSEWVKQKKTQQKYMLQQIAALKVYAGHAANGYKLVRSGLQTIDKIKDGDLKLHETFFGSLSKINPEIKASSKVPEIIRMQIDINKQIKKVIKQCRASKLAEQGYLESVLGKVLNDCDLLLDELIRVSTSGSTDMTDDERIKLFDRIYVSMQDNKVFVKEFGNSAIQLAKQRNAEAKEVRISKLLNGLR